MREFILLSINKQKKRLSLIMIQFLIGTIALMFGFSTLFEVVRFKNDVETLAPLEATQIYLPTTEFESLETNKLKDTYKLLKEKKIVEKLGMFETEEIFPYKIKWGDSLCQNPIQKKYIGNEDNFKSEDMIFTAIVNDDMLNLIQFRLKDGKVDKLKNYKKNKKKEIPVLISESLADLNPINSIREIPSYTDTGKEEIYTVKVVGVLDRDMPFWSGGRSTFSEGLIKNKDLVIIPQFREFNNPITLTCNVLAVFNKKQYDFQLQMSNQIFSDNNFIVELDTLSDEVENYLLKQKILIFSSLAFSILILILALFGLSGLILASIARRKKEFGIYYALGMTTRMIMYLIIGEIGSIFAVSFTLSTIISVVVMNKILHIENFFIDEKIVLITLLIKVLCFSISILIPIQRISKLQPVSLITGRED